MLIIELKSLGYVVSKITSMIGNLTKLACGEGGLLPSMCA